MFRTLLSVILAASIASAFPQSSNAETASKQVSVRVRYGDLNLGTDAGAQTMFRRLKLASRQICGRRPPLNALKAITQHDACMQDTMASAVADLGSPAVTAQLTAQNEKTTASR